MVRELTGEEIRAALLEGGRKARRAVREFVAGAAAGDPKRMQATFEILSYGHHDGGGWLHAMRAILRLGSVPDETRAYFLRVHIQYGDHIRQETADDVTLVRALRVLLPSYSGPGLVLYRGEQAENRRRRTYGASWTTELHVADSFAQECRGHPTGSVLLETFATPEAIISAPAGTATDRYAEREYLIDRRQLRNVKVLKRYAHQSPGAKVTLAT